MYISLENVHKNAKTWEVLVKEISAIANESVGVHPIKTAEQQVIGVYQIITDCWKMTYTHTHTHTHHVNLTAAIDRNDTVKATSCHPV